MNTFSSNIRKVAGLVTGCVLLGGLVLVASALPGREVVIGSYVTSLAERTNSQAYNVSLACRKLNGKVILPGQTFSFLKTVGSWTADQGYIKAPVSYDGELVRSWGGGVCQASSTLYNAALLAGLDIVQRDRHHFAPRYVPPGRDAAVAYEDIDLKIRNNLKHAVRIEAGAEDGTVSIKILGASRLPYQVRIESAVKSITQPGEIVQNRSVSGNGRRKIVNRGHIGFQVNTYRLFIYKDHTIRQMISDDRYPAMNRIVRIMDR